MHGASNVAFDHAIQVIYGPLQSVVIYSEAGALPRTVFNVVGLVQNQDLARQVDLHLVKVQIKTDRCLCLELSSWCFCSTLALNFYFYSHFP